MAEGYNGIDPNLLLAKMNNGDDDDKTLWLFLLLLMFSGRRGFGFGGDEGVGVRDVVSLADLNAAQNALQTCIQGGTAAITERTYDITRDQATNALRNESNQARIQEIVNKCCFDLQSGQCDIRQAVADCCCRLGIGLKDVERAVSDCCCQLGIGQKDIVNALEKCCCETQNQLQMGFAAVNNNICSESAATRQAIHAEGEATRALINQHRMEDLQNQLNICRDELSNQRQTTVLQETIREQCGHQWPWWGNGGGPPFGQGPATAPAKK